jgi:hypothetical protein
MGGLSLMSAMSDAKSEGSKLGVKLPDEPPFDVARNIFFATPNYYWSILTSRVITSAIMVVSFRLWQ